MGSGGLRQAKEGLSGKIKEEKDKRKKGVSPFFIAGYSSIVLFSCLAFA